jgi:pimeloyl-ACP methyl ester carboxylesterase
VRRLTSVVAVLALLLLLVGGAALVLTEHPGRAGGVGPTPITPSGGPAPTRPPAADLAPYYGQTLHWSDCDSGDRCAKLTVPLDYARPTAETIQLAVLQVPAADPGSRVGALVTDPGGPGAPGTSYAALGSQAFGQPLLDHYDIVGFDPRGTGRSSPVDCLSDSRLDAYVAQDPAPSTPAEVATYRTLQRENATGCASRSGALASHISTVEAARDMDVLRAALGEPRLNYLGFSYGTELGAVYAQLFPKRVGRFVLDGAVDPALSARQSDLQQAAGFQRALDSYAANCVGSSVGCFLGSSVAEVQKTVDDLLSHIAQQPLPAGNGRVLTEGNAFYGIAVTLYSRAYWVLLTNALRAALSGDGSQLLMLSDAYTHRTSDGTYSDNEMEAFYAITCLDDPVSIPVSQVPAQYPAFEKASPVFGKEFAWSLAGCRGFTAHSANRIPPIHAKGAAPIVVIGTTRDPATPFAWAVNLAHELESGVLIRRDGDGHTGYHAGNSCVDHAVESYLVSGAVPPDNLSCCPTRRGRGSAAR